jgi:lysophospholipid acyltransferase (LPLAT)-like uncharacterized protein
VRHVGTWQRTLLAPLGWLVKLWCRSLRFDADPESLAIYRRNDIPVAFVLWHNRLFLAGEIIRRYRTRKAYALVSASKDGAWLEAFFDMVGLHCVRGSSSKLGREAASGMIEKFREGNDIGITPDGPRGPCYDFKPGALIVARRAHGAMLLIGAGFSSRWQLKSWDRFILPLPFSKIRLRAALIPPEAVSGDRDEAAATLRAQLLALNPDD